MYEVLGEANQRELEKNSEEIDLIDEIEVYFKKCFPEDDKIYWEKTQSNRKVEKEETILEAIVARDPDKEIFTSTFEFTEM